MTSPGGALEQMRARSVLAGGEEVGMEVSRVRQVGGGGEEGGGEAGAAVEAPREREGTEDVSVRVRCRSLGAACYSMKQSTELVG